MASTRRVMHAIEGSHADMELVAALVASPSEADAAIAFSLLRNSLNERELVMLANLREVLAAVPEAPFRTGEPLGLLERAGGYEATGRSYRRLFESSHGVFGLEFVGQINTCEDIVVHTTTKRFRLTRRGDDEFDATMLTLFVNHGILLDAVIEALGLLGQPMDPQIYVTAEDFVSEHGAAAASAALGELF